MNKWLNGKAAVSPAICQFYRDSQENQEQFAYTLEDVILPSLCDDAMVVQKIHDLIVLDSSISEYRKRKLFEMFSNDTTEKRAVFLAKALIFAMNQQIPDRKSGTADMGDSSPFLRDYFLGGWTPDPCPCFCGREQEIGNLRQSLERDRIVFLYGVPGIGKSELAKAYAKQYQRDYRNILYILFSGDIKTDIAKLPAVDDYFTDNDTDRFEKHHRFLQTLREDSLIIIDDYYITPGGSDIREILQRYRCHVLVTTRCYIAGQHNFLLEELQNPEDLFRIASCFYSYAGANRVIVEQIIDVFHSHTFTTELSAKLLEYGILKPPMVLMRLQIAGVAYDYNDKLPMKINGRNEAASFYEHIHNLFGLDKLTEKQQYIIACMSLIPFDGIRLRLFGDWMDARDMNEIRTLIELGYIQLKPGSKIALHPMTWEIALADTTPGVSRCRVRPVFYAPL